MRFRVYFVLLSFFCFLSHANAALIIEEELNADKTISSLFQQQLNAQNQPIAQRLFDVSNGFLSKPYFLGALGEGLKGQYDQYPLYRTDAFDCLTFVETVLAISLAHNLESFKHGIKKIRYRKGNVSFISRNHFTDLDWNLNNQKEGILTDITLKFHDEKQQRIALLAHAKIDKPSWYQHFSISRIRLKERSVAEQRRRLIMLKKSGLQLRSEDSSIPYIPLTVLFDDEGKPNQYVFKQIPDGSVIEIVRPNWDLTESIGTHLNVSHLGFAFWRKGILIFRNASSSQGAVVDQPLIEYLQLARQSPTIKGINIQWILAQ